MSNGQQPETRRSSEDPFVQDSAKIEPSSAPEGDEAGPGPVPPDQRAPSGPRPPQEQRPEDEDPYARQAAIDQLTGPEDVD